MPSEQVFSKIGKWTPLFELGLAAKVEYWSQQQRICHSLGMVHKRYRRAFGSQPWHGSEVDCEVAPSPGTKR
jgi:hypothetical protein